MIRKVDIVNRKGKQTIVWLGDIKGRMSILELYRELQDIIDAADVGCHDLMDIASPSIVYRYSDSNIEVTEPYDIDPGLFEHLHGGTLIHRGKSYNMLGDDDPCPHCGRTA